jgi:hypothetical protein
MAISCAPHSAGAYGGAVDDEHDLDAGVDPGTAGESDADGRVDDEPFERPVDRFRKGAVGSVMAAGLLGLADAFEARPPKEEVVIVREVPTEPPREPRRLELLLDPEHPERSLVFLPEPTDPTPRREPPPEEPTAPAR